MGQEEYKKMTKIAIGAVDFIKSNDIYTAKGKNSFVLADLEKSINEVSFLVDEIFALKDTLQAKKIEYDINMRILKSLTKKGVKKIKKSLSKRKDIIRIDFNEKKGKREQRMIV